MLDFVFDSHVFAGHIVLYRRSHERENDFDSHVFTGHIQRVKTAVFLLFVTSIRTYSQVTSAKSNSFLSYSILLFADLYKVYQTIPIISSKSSGLSLYFPDFLVRTPVKSS